VYYTPIRSWYVVRRLFKFGAVPVQNAEAVVKLMVKPHTPVPEVTKANWAVDASEFQFIVASSFSRRQVTGQPACVIVLVPAGSIGLITSEDEPDSGML